MLKRTIGFVSALLLLASYEQTSKADALADASFFANPEADTTGLDLESVSTQDPTTTLSQDGVYACVSPLITRTQGFWKNHPCVVDGYVGGNVLVPVELGHDLVLHSSAEVSAYLQTAPRGDGQIILGHQLLAAKLNAEAFYIGCILYADIDYDGYDDTVDELIDLGDYLFDYGTDAQQKYIAGVLDALNNAGDYAYLPFNPSCGGK